MVTGIVTSTELENLQINVQEKAQKYKVTILIKNKFCHFSIIKLRSTY